MTLSKPSLAWPLVVFTLLVIAGAAWVALDRRPPEWDHANHLERALLCGRDLRTGDVQAIIERSSFYPAFVPCAAALFSLLIPSHELAAQFVMWLALGFGILATYLLGRRVASPAVGAVAAVLFGTAPFVAYIVLRFQLDLPLAAMVALTLWALASSASFTRRGWSLATGVLFGLGMLTKPPFAVYVMPAVLLALRRIRHPGVAINMAIATVIAIVVSLPWYGPRALGLLAQVTARSGKQAAEAGQPDTLTAASLFFYPRWFVTQFGVVAIVLFLVGLVMAARRRQGLILVSVIAPFALFLVIQNKNLRYTLPILPAAAVIAALAVDALRERGRVAIAAIVGIGAVAQVAGTMFAVPSVGQLPGLAVPWVIQSPPMLDDWKQRPILELLERTAGSAPATVSVVPNVDYFSVSNFRYYALRDGLSFRWMRAWDAAPLGVDYIVMKSGAQGPSWTAEKPRRIGERFETDARFAQIFPAIGEFRLPDGSVATVRARRIPPSATPPERIAAAVAAAVRREIRAFARDVDGLDIVVDGDADLARGRLKQLTITARSALVGELKRADAALLRVHDLRITATHLLVDPATVVERGRFELLDADRITVEQGRIDAADLQAFLSGLRRFRRATVVLENGTAVIRLQQAGPDVSARLRFMPADDRPFMLVADEVALGRLVLPSALVNWVVRNYDPTPRMAARLPVPVRVRPIAIGPDAVRIGGAGEAGRR
ncbi:MAG: glycosyltransferase family 39 protein [Candidatus Rokubacteria bacterium]|nr:glycosyltransferase family 39 protein [Candidatus Rokubacteria bacterium]